MMTDRCFEGYGFLLFLLFLNPSITPNPLTKGLIELSAQWVQSLSSITTLPSLR